MVLLNRKGVTMMNVDIYNLKAIVDKLNYANKKRLLKIATEILDGEINSFTDYQELQ